VGHRATAVGGILTGDGDDLRQLLGAEGAGPARSRLIGEHAADQRGKILVAGVLLFGGVKSDLSGRPPIPPSSHSLPIHSELSTQRRVANPIGRQQEEAA